MGWKDFASTVVGDVLTYVSTVIGHVLSWPVVALTIVLLLLGPIRLLLSRLKTAKGLGSEFLFEIESLQGSTVAAVEAVEDVIAPPAETDTQPGTEAAEDIESSQTMRFKVPITGERYTALMRQLTQRAGRDGSMRDRLAVQLRKGPEDAVQSAWAAVRGKLVALHAHLLGVSPSATGTSVILGDLAESPHVPPAFIETVQSLYDIRTRVDQGIIDPDAHLALTYVSSALQMETIADTLLRIDIAPQQSEP